MRLPQEFEYFERVYDKYEITFVTLKIAMVQQIANSI